MSSIGSLFRKCLNRNLFYISNIIHTSLHLSLPIRPESRIPYISMNGWHRKILLYKKIYRYAITLLLPGCLINVVRNASPQRVIIRGIAGVCCCYILHLYNVWNAPLLSYRVYIGPWISHSTGVQHGWINATYRLILVNFGLVTI